MQKQKTIGRNHSMANDPASNLNYIKKLRNKAEITRNAHSYSRWAFGTIAISLKAIIIGGSTIATTLVFSNYSIFNDVLKAIFNIEINTSIFIVITGILTLLVFILSLMELVLNYDKRAGRHDQAVKQLTVIIRDMTKTKDTGIIDDSNIEFFNKEYNSINKACPTIPDLFFIRSKKKYLEKRAMSIELETNPFKSLREIRKGLRTSYNKEKYE